MVESIPEPVVDNQQETHQNGSAQVENGAHGGEPTEDVKQDPEPVEEEGKVAQIEEGEDEIDPEEEALRERKRKYEEEK